MKTNMKLGNSTLQIAKTMKQIKLSFLLIMLMSMTGTKAFAHDIEVANSDGVTIYYKWANDAKTELAVTFRGQNSYSYSDEYTGDVVIPESVVYNEIPYSVTSIGNNAFYYCSGLTSVTIPNSVTTIGEFAFEDCSGLNSITIPNSVISIGSDAFAGTAMYNNQPEGLLYIDKFLIKYKGDMPANTDITIKKGTRGIAGAAFKDCENLTSVTIPNSVKSIGDNAFNGCSGLTSITIPNSVKIIDDAAFSYCTGLTSLIIPNSVTSIGNNAFYGCNGLYSVIIGNGVTTIGYYAFYNCRMTSVIIGSGVTSIESRAFDSNNLVKILWLPNTPPSGYSNVSGIINYVSNDLYTSISHTKIKYQFLSSYFDVDGIRYVPVSPSEKTCDAIDCVYDESATNTKVSSTVAYKGVTLAVKNIRPYLAYNNKFIRKLTVNNNGELADHVFSYCSNMKSATLGSKVSAIGSHAFQGCSLLQTIDIPDIVPVLNVYTFADCVSLKEIKIKPKMTDIKNSVFNNCTRLTKVIIADSETVLNLGSNESNNGYYGGYLDYGNPLFSSCPLDTVYIGRNIDYNTSSTYGYSPFYRNTSLRAVKITDEETEISENEFYGCTNLKIVKIGNGVTTIDNWAFSGCTSLDFFSYGSNVASIGKEAFSDCMAMTKLISLATTPPFCGDQALDDINKWECKLYVPKGSIKTYQNAEQWKEFFFTEEIVSKVKLNKSKATIEKGKTLTLKATVSSSVLLDKSVTWKSSNTKVATVTSKGKVKGVKAGTATITCTSTTTGAKATCKVTVGYVKLDQTEAIVQKGKTMTLTPTVYPSTLTDQSVTWESSDKKVATVTSKGKVKGVKAGTATITCTSNATGLKTTCAVTVGYVKLDQTETAIQKGKTKTLTATVYPSKLEDKSVTWESSDTKVATVTSKGKVKGVKAGTATITCTSNATGLKTTCKVTVGYVKLDQTEVTVKKGKTVTLTATVYPSSLTDKSVTWESSDTKIATVTSAGKLKGIKAGTATITCTSNATGLSTTCTVTVTGTTNSRALDGDDDDTTVIEEMNVAETEPFDVYDLSGRKIRHQVTSLDGLPNGIYIVNGRKVLKKD